MKRMKCPLNGERNIAEFIYGGECHDMPNPESSSSATWAEYVFFHENKAGIVLEWWCHAPTSYWFLAERNTLTDEIVRTFEASERFGGSNVSPQSASNDDRRDVDER
ncbi:MAG: sarcosine oxidase subunit delta [Pseudomonadota bacterium]